MSAKRFQIAFSFAGGKRDFVTRIAAVLAKLFGEATILYDAYHKAEFSRSDLVFYLPDLYEKEADVVVAVFCPDYENKEWCGLEWNAIYGLLKTRQVEEVMLTRFERVEAKGLRGLAGYSDLDDLTPEQAAHLILERLALNEGKPKEHYKAARPPEAAESPASGKQAPTNEPMKKQPQPAKATEETEPLAVMERKRAGQPKLDHMRSGATGSGIDRCVPILIPCSISIPVPGKWLVRPEDDPGVYWALIGNTPGDVSIEPGEVYRLEAVHGVTDGELVGLASLRDLGTFHSLSLAGCEMVTEAGLAHLRQFSGLRSLELFMCWGATDAGLAHLQGLTDLRELNLMCADVTDGGLYRLRGLGGLETLDLTGCDQVTDGGLAHLRRLTRLRDLNLNGCKQITDRGLYNIRMLTGLESLDLTECDQVTDYGLVQLRELTGMRYLNLRECKQVTKGGVQELKKALPRCDISQSN